MTFQFQNLDPRMSWPARTVQEGREQKSSEVALRLRPVTPASGSSGTWQTAGAAVRALAPEALAA